jgi:hypothetical protein
MINQTQNIVLDTMSDVYRLLVPWRTHEFWDFATHDIVPNSIYVLGREQFIKNINRIRELCERPDLCIVFDNVAEGSWTLVSQLQMLRVEDLILNHHVLLLGGGDMPADYPYLRYDHFISCILDYDENLNMMQHSNEIFDNTHKPYSFLFLNGRARPHRKYLWERFKELNILDRVLWTMLDSRPSIRSMFELERNGINIMATTTELRWLPREYEFDFFKDSTIVPGPAERTFVKPELFKNLWGDIYLDIAPYRETYFSLVTETICAESTHSFRTEKIAKPLAIAHPWIAVANSGFYRDMHNLGFQTFGNIIDESFDTIDNPQDRLERIIAVVQDLVSGDLPAFLRACEPVCKYNQQHLKELAPQIRAEFPDKFFNFIKTHNE